MTFKAVLQALEAKIYRRYTNFKIFIRKNVTKFARLQTLKGTCTCE